MAERTGVVTFKGKPITLIGPEMKAGEKAPDVELTDNNMGSAKLSSYKGNVLVIASVPSLDTPVCDLETKRFNDAAKELGDSVKIVTVSMDLPFAQARWCVAAHAKNVNTLSDYKNKDFGKAYGTLIKELQLLSRAVFVVDANGTIKYVQYVKEITEQPNFDEILSQIKTLTKK